MGVGGRFQPLEPVKHGAPNYIPMTTISSLALKELMFSGRSFHSYGAATAKERPDL